MRDFIPKALAILIGFIVLLSLNVYWIKVEGALLQTLIQTACIILTIFIMARFKSTNSID